MSSPIKTIPSNLLCKELLFSEKASHFNWTFFIGMLHFWLVVSADLPDAKL